MRILLGRVKGDKGDTGSQGPRGQQGERGPQGPPGEPGQTDIYTRAESDARYQLKGESVDFQELARRIPTWQWKVTMPRTAHQTVTATVGSQTYTSDFYAPQGSNVTFSARGATGYIEGAVSPTSATLTGDLAVTVTAATESKNVEAGTQTFDSGQNDFLIPLNAQTLKLTWNGKDTYARVTPGWHLYITIEKYANEKHMSIFYIESMQSDLGAQVLSSERLYTSVVISWSTEINAHAIDIDYTTLPGIQN